MLLKRENKIVKKRYLLLIIGILLLFIPSFLLFYIYFNIYKDNLDEQNQIKEFLNTKQNINVAMPKLKEEETTKKTSTNDNFIAVLEIPKISLKKGLYTIGSKYNNVDKTVKVLDKSIFPNEEQTSHLYLASHSGNSIISYFKNINKLQKGDIINIYYKNHKYTYKVLTKYYINKTGEFIVKETIKSNIYLITCDKENRTKQLVVYAELKGD